MCQGERVRENRRNRREQYAWYERSRANLPHRIEARRKYQKEHTERISKYKIKWAKENSERIAATKRDHYERNRRKRRAAKCAGCGNFTAREFKEHCEKYGNRCLRCGDTETVLEADHVVPLTRGGSDDISNIQPLGGYCNRSKFVDIVDYRAGDGPLVG